MDVELDTDPGLAQVVALPGSLTVLVGGALRAVGSEDDTPPSLG